MLPKKLKPVEIPRVRFKDGTILGEQIPGSRFVRSICDQCAELIRVTKASACDYCIDCDPCQPLFHEPKIALTREMADKRLQIMAACENN